VNAIKVQSIQKREEDMSFVIQTPYQIHSSQCPSGYQETVVHTATGNTQLYCSPDYFQMPSLASSYSPIPPSIYATDNVWPPVVQHIVNATPASPPPSPAIPTTSPPKRRIFRSRKEDTRDNDGMLFPYLAISATIVLLFVLVTKK